ncbi:hypothetical protein AAFC00_006932 [Neodothiora populina]|uniref:DNA polymerase delta subunit 4 n=1 Tax=Neodothiora populina TaxID=2781224 RepID=A0ABR3PC88_9PEZI
MPPKRRTSTPLASARSSQRAAQSTLSFHKQGPNRVTKPGAAQRNVIAKKEPTLLDEVIVDDEQSDAKSPTTAQAAITEQAVSVKAELDDALQSGPVRTEDVLGGKATADDTGAVGGRSGSGWNGDEEARARRVTDAQIKRYWQTKERERKAPRVHQEGLSVQDKLLREWDMSGQYGPCIGIARLKRWKRANMLNLDPPIEVLAVLLKQADKGSVNVQRAYVDELMSSRFIET